MPVYILPDKAADGEARGKKNGAWISHGGSSDRDREGELGRHLIGSPSAAYVTQSGKMMVPVIEVQTWEWPERRYVLVLRLEERETEAKTEGKK